jgi:hypothetical protein
MKKQKNDFVSVKILRADYKKAMKWAIVRDMKFYQVISLLINK